MTMNARAVALGASLWLLTPCSSTWAQPAAAPPAPVETASPAVVGKAARLKAHVAFLADDLLEGRAAGTRGHEIAARYMAAQLALAGAAPGGREGSWFQQVQLHESRPSRTGEMVLTLPGGSRTVRHGEDALVVGATRGGDVTVTAPLVFVGYGISDERLGLDDYAGLDVRDKIVVRLMGVPQGLDSEVAAHLQSTGERAAAQRGAVGGVSIPTRAFVRATPWERAVEMRRDGGATTWVRSTGEPFTTGWAGAGVSAAVSQQVAATLFEGTGRTLDEILEEADRPGGRPRGMVLPGSATITVSTETRRYATPAVLGVIAGRDPALRHEFVLLTAHLDHLGVKTSGDGDRIHNGALDNALGSAMLVEVARALAPEGRRPRRSVLLVAHTAEEKGLLGAFALAADLPVPRERVVASVNLDMPVLLHDFTDVVAFGGNRSSLEGAIARVAATQGITLSPDPMPDAAVFVRSDHYALVRAGIPSIMLSPGMADGGKAGFSLFLGTHYHQVTDEVTLPINWSAAARFARLNEAVLRELADTETPVRWYEGDYFGETFAPDAPKVPRPTPKPRAP